MILDPFIPTSRHKCFIPFLNERSVVAVAQSALQRDMKFNGSTEAEVEEVSRLLTMHVSGHDFYCNYASKYHLYLWWSTIGIERSSMLAPNEMHVFSI